MKRPQDMKRGYAACNAKQKYETIRRIFTI